MIHININLSAKPFVNNRRFFLITVLLTLLLVTILYGNISLYRGYRQRNAEFDRQFAKTQVKLENLTKDQSAIVARLQAPEATGFLDLIDFINLRIRQRTFSWTRLLNDLETLVPANLQIVSIRPQVVGNEFDIEIMANGRSSQDYIEFITRLEASDKFLEVRPVSEDVSKTPGFVGKQVTLRVKYKGQT